MSESTALQRTPVYEAHRRLGARLVEFAGFEMPVQYTSILEEHAAVRERAGLFDVSHMGQIHLSGSGCVATAEHLLTCPVESLRIGGIRYGLLCNDRGGVVDDVTVYRLGEDEIMLCVNASNIAKDHAWILAHAGSTVVEDRSAETGLLALQGPAASLLMQEVAGPGVLALRRFGFASLEVSGVRAVVSNTGYTGSPGYEIYLEAASTEAVFERLLEAGSSAGVVAAGLGARDTLRLEAALPLYGHELDDDTSPLQAGLDRFVKVQAAGFVGAEAIAARAAAGHPQVLVGFELEDRGVARAGHAILRDGESVGHVTSGAPSPTLGRSIGLGYVPPEATEPGTGLGIEVRQHTLAARVVKTPFVTKTTGG
ncbi:MAG: glycine cleavage system aminomethyltransferase GcvT [Myxococcota bacterium]|nr:glycine cleavage system aminomethyltransferase GcvT [Myxococcota bacterium]